MEFLEVMKQWRRFCKSHSNCGECEFDGKGICGEAHLSDVPMEIIEQDIMQWAAEHPEPVYPTWHEWLKEQNILAVEYTPRASSTTGASTSYIQRVSTRPAFYRPIPADIAQKLGLKPKEG